jgi:effector-binding domain-containing protein
MGVSVSVQVVSSRLIAAVSRQVAMGGVGAAWRPALDQVWTFLRAQPGLRTDGQNIFLYHHPARRGDPMDVDFGVEVVREFAPSGEVRPVKTPAGEVVAATHIGPYDRLGRAHDAVQAFAAANNRAFAGTSWEIYGDWSEDPATLETIVMYLLR